MTDQHERMFRPQNAPVLDSADRQVWLPSGLVLDTLDVAPGTSVADVGAGTGYFALPLVQRVGPRGRVHAVDIQPEMLAVLQQRVPPGSPLVPVHGAAEATTLPDASQNLVLYANVWHEIDRRDAALAEAERILGWGGRIAILDWRADCPPPPGPPTDHRLSGVAVSDYLRKASWRGISLQRIGTYSYLVTARRPIRSCARCCAPRAG